MLWHAVVASQQRCAQLQLYGSIAHMEYVLECEVIALEQSAFPSNLPSHNHVIQAHRGLCFSHCVLRDYSSRIPALTTRGDHTNPRLRCCASASMSPQ